MATAKELRIALESVPDDTIVIVSADSEGNRYSPASSAYDVMYDFREREVWPTPEDLAHDEYATEEDAAPEHAVRALCIYPEW